MSDNDWLPTDDLGSPVHVGPEAPSDPNVDDLWYDPDVDRLMVYKPEPGYPS